MRERGSGFLRDGAGARDVSAGTVGFGRWWREGECRGLELLGRRGRVNPFLSFFSRIGVLFPRVWRSCKYFLFSLFVSLGDSGPSWHLLFFCDVVK